LLDDAIPSGERRTVVTREVVPPPLGETAVLVRTDLESGASAALQGSPGAARVTLRLDEGCRTVVFFASSAQPSISVEPQSVAPGAASQPEGHPLGLVGLAPGATTRLAVTVVVGDA
jgi:galactose mutarotase-like enzyme